ncbi:MAG: SpoIIE family protein phosphatase [Candidatus Krumholzibacteria bacterium]|nr:SpoIIE family protein phosphatase [Candidatus Krumholzibacteria bacterium]
MKAISLKMQIVLLETLVIAGMVAAVSWTVITNEKKMLMAESLERLVLEGRNLALSSAKPLLHEDPEFELHPLVIRAQEAETDIISIVVVDRKGLIKGHRDVLLIDRSYEPVAGLRGVAATGLAQSGEEIRENDEIIEVKIPITDQGEPIGFVYLEYAKAEVLEAISLIKARMFRIGILALGFGVVFSLMLAPQITRPVRALTKGAEAIGQGRLDTRIEVAPITELQTLAKTFNGMAQSLEENQKSLVEQERIRSELAIAHEIQATLLPTRLPRLDNFEVDAYYHSASEVGGDYYDLVPVDENHLMIVIGDVAGKGVPGLVIMAMVRVLVRALAQSREEPATLLRHLNVLFRKDIKRNMFVTLSCGILDVRDGSLVFANAGHMPPIICRGARRAAEALPTKAKPIGIFPDEIFCRGLEEHRVTLGPGDCVLQYTDGLSEMRNADGEEYGIERLMKVVADEASGGARHLVSELRKSLGSFRGDAPQSDDLTIVAINAMPSGARHAPIERIEQPDRIAFE